MPLTNDLSLKGACRLLKTNDARLADAIDAVLGPAIVLSGLAATAAGVPGALGFASSLLGPKSELAAAANKLLRYIADNSYGGALDRYQRMQAAYSLLAYVGFFQAVDATFPKIRRDFRLSRGEKLFLVELSEASLAEGDAERAIESAPKGIRTPQRPDSAAAGEIVEEEIPLPHPTETTEDVESRLERLYENLAHGYQRFVYGLSAWADADEKTRMKIQERLNALPREALVHYHAAYLDLAHQFPEFFVWATLQNQVALEDHLGELSSHWRHQLMLITSGAQRVDLGLSALASAIEALPDALMKHAPSTAVREIQLRYADYINQPVIDEEFPPAPGAEPLKFPKRSEAFVPQAFRVLRATGGERLEDEATWNALPAREDLGVFLLSYLQSPYSFRSPLLILGDPGSGKSLLTHVLAARLAQTRFTPIRVALRELEAEEVAQQIEEQVSLETHGQRVSWPALSTTLSEAPPVVLLDGYDELLQASGKAFAGLPSECPTVPRKRTDARPSSSTRDRHKSCDAHR